MTAALHFKKIFFACPKTPTGAGARRLGDSAAPCPHIRVVFRAPGGPPAHSSSGLPVLTENPSEGSERSHGGRRALSGPLSEGLLTESPSAAPSISTPLGGRVNATFSISLAHGLPAAAPLAHIRVTS
jgi:hypothetical protein